MLLCKLCGNKRCPHANDHDNACTKSNNTGDTGTPATDPKFSGLLSAVTGWRITDPTSYTLNVGASVPVWRDFFGSVRSTGFMDIGASEQ